MPDNCCVFGCHNKGGQTDENGQKLRFFSIPAVSTREDEVEISTDRPKAWIAAIKRENWTPSKSTKVCSAHFHKGKSLCKNLKKKRATS